MNQEKSNLRVIPEQDVQATAMSHDNEDQRQREKTMNSPNTPQGEMPQSFSLISGLGIAFSVTNSWAIYISIIGQELIYGGPQTAILGLLVAAFVQWTITLGLSELASAFPSSGGQYHYVYILAPGKAKKVSAYFVGWLSIIAWFVGVSSGVSVVAINIFGLVSFWDTSFVSAQWMVYMLHLGTVAVTFLPQYFAPKLVPKITSLALYISLSGFILTLVISLAMKKNFNASSYIIESNLGQSGWPQGFAWILGIINPMYAFGATDAVIHISGELPNPRVKIPLIMNLCIFIGIITVFPVTSVLMYTMNDMEAVISSTLPGAELIYQATGSKPVTTFLMCLVILAYATSVCSGWVASGRLAWAFACDGGIPFQSYFVHIDPVKKYPLRTTMASVIFVSLYGLLFLASSTAFNSIVATAVLFLTITFAVPQSLLALRGRGKHLPPRPLNLGQAGYIVNMFSAVAAVAIVILSCFPPLLPVSFQNMNYCSVVIAGIFGALIILWFAVGRRRFVGPKLDIDIQISD